MKLLGVLLILGGTQALAAEIPTHQLQEAQNIAQKIERNKSKITEAEVKQRQILSHLFEINRRMKKIAQERSNLETEKRLVQKSIEDLNEKISGIQATLQNKGRNLINHIRWIHQTRGLAWLNMFSGNRGATDTDLNLYIFNKMTEKEKEKIVAYIEAKIQLQKNQEKLKARWQRLEKVTSDLATKEKDFLSQQANRKVALNSIRSQKSKFIEKMRELRNDKLVQKLEDTGLLDGLIRASFLEEKGKLLLPVQGVLTQRFGIVKAPESSYYKNHKGIFIQTNEQQPIQAVFEGKVAFVGPVGGFGQTLILDHGDHYYTVYSSLANVNVKVGDLIEKNAAIGQVGASEFYGSPGVYFEVRHFSEPQDPLEWVKKGIL